MSFGKDSVSYTNRLIKENKNDWVQCYQLSARRRQVIITTARSRQPNGDIMCQPPPSLNLCWSRCLQSRIACKQRNTQHHNNNEEASKQVTSFSWNFENLVLVQWLIIIEKFAQNPMKYQ